MPLDDDEHLAAQTLNGYLQHLGWKVTWRPIDDDPPDTEFTVGRYGLPDERWAVEIRGIFQFVRWRNGRLNLRAVAAPLQRICARLNALLDPNVSVGYIMSVSGPFQVDIRILEANARNYINEGRVGREALDVQEREESRVYISAIPNLQGVHVLPMLDGTGPIPDGTAMIAEIGPTLEYTVDDALQDKLPTLRALTGYDRKILLLWTDYFFADVASVGEILTTRCLTPTDLDAIFLVESNGFVGPVADPGQLFL